MLSVANFDLRLIGAVVFIFGLMIGSFLNVVIYRLPAEASIVWPGSHCPKCKRALNPWENIPVLSWLFLRGRCHTCRSPISWRYPAIELLTGVLFLAVFLRWGLTLQTGFLLVFVALLIVIFWIDFDTQFIFDQTTFPGMALGLLYSYVVTGQFLLALSAALFGAAAIALVYGMSWLILREEGIGGGDLTLMVMLGAWLGIQGMLLSLFIGILIGAVMGMLTVFTGYIRERFWAPVVLAACSGLFIFSTLEAFFRFLAPFSLRLDLHVGLAAIAILLGTSLGYFYTRATRDRGTEKPRIPFGPALVMGGLTTLFWGDPLVNWYFAQMGPI